MMGEWGPTTSRTVDLGFEQLLTLEDRPGTRIKVIHGGVWLTEEGDPRDVFAGSGEEVALRLRRRALIEGLGAARIEVIEPVTTARWRAFGKAVESAARLRRRLKSLAAPSSWSPATPRGTIALLAIVVGVAIPTLVIAGMAAAASLPAPFI